MSARDSYAQTTKEARAAGLRRRRFQVYLQDLTAIDVMNRAAAALRAGSRDPFVLDLAHRAHEDDDERWCLSSPAPGDVV